MRYGTARVGNGTELITLEPREISVVVNDGLRTAEAGSDTAIRLRIGFVPFIWPDCPAVERNASLGVDRVEGDVLPSAQPR
jgi:hypothetical protein